jgi:hypothetical protein|tara:strand:- start:487 stop:714 length:228 start_codon:yes stop_codon:yes gene_type:complete
MDTGVELAQSARTIIRGGTALSSALGREAVKIDFNSELNYKSDLSDSMKSALKGKKISKAEIPYFERKYGFKLSA